MNDSQEIINAIPEYIEEINAGSDPGPVGYIECPICHQRVPAEILPDHLRIHSGGTASGRILTEEESALASGAAPAANTQKAHIAKTCVLCGKCDIFCAPSAIKNSGGTYVVFEAACVGCGECVPVCPVKAIEMW